MTIHMKCQALFSQKKKMIQNDNCWQLLLSGLKSLELEIWSERHVKMAQIDYPIRQAEGKMAQINYPIRQADAFGSPYGIVDLSHFNMHF